MSRFGKKRVDCRQYKHHYQHSLNAQVIHESQWDSWSRSVVFLPRCERGGTQSAVEYRDKTDKEDNVFNVGDQAPDFTLQNDASDEVTLSSLRGKPVILYWYPKDDTPG